MIKNLECRGSNGKVFTHEIQVARRELPGIAAGQMTEGFEREASLLINDGNI